MSVELRWSDNCHLECDWGVVEYGDPRPDRAEVGSLMLITDDYLLELLNAGRPVESVSGARHQVVVSDDRLFAHLDYHGQHWVWELFNAHFQDFMDGDGPGIHIGRWPD